jgi:hypothetical protein
VNVEWGECGRSLGYSSGKLLGSIDEEESDSEDGNKMFKMKQSGQNQAEAPGFIARLWHDNKYIQNLDV